RILSVRCYTLRRPSAICALSLHDALPIFDPDRADAARRAGPRRVERALLERRRRRNDVGGESCGRVARGRAIARERSFRLGEIKDRKSTRLNSSHQIISYAVFCLKKKKKQ